MAIESKRMQQRSGTYEQFLAHKSEFLPNEFEIVTSGDPNTSGGKSVYFSFNPNDTKRLMTAEDAAEDIAKATEGATAAANNAAESAQDSADQAKNYYDQIPVKIEESKQEIADYTESMKQTIPEDYTQLQEDVSLISNEINNLIKREVLLPNFPVIPYKIYVDTHGEFSINNIPSHIITEDYITYYVDCENGSDSNSGLEKGSALKTLKKALTEYVSSSTNCIIQIIGEHPVFYSDDLYGECLIKKSLIIRSEYPAKIICGVKAIFTKVQGYDNVYVSQDLSSYTFGYCVNISDDNIDEMGLYAPMIKVNSISDVNATENSYFISENVIYSHCTTAVPILDTYKWRFNHNLSTTSHILYEENLNIIGCNFDSTRNKVTEDDIIFERYSIDCIYQHNVKSNAITFSNYDICYVVNSKAGYSKNDGFNYDMNYSTEERIKNSVYIQLNCAAKECGYYNEYISGNDNLSTAHKGLNIARIGFRGYNSGGPMIVDVNGCRSIIIDCEVINTKYNYTPDSIKGCYEFNDAGSFREGLVTLQKCIAYDIRKNFVGISCESKAEIRECVFPNGIYTTSEIIPCKNIL